MKFSYALYTGACILLLLPAGCANPPQDYSPGYSYVATNTGFGTAKSATGSVLVPNACLGEPADTDPAPAATDLTVVPSLGPHLPPGCANAYNLQRMVESQRDLVEGRQMGPAAAAPTVRAARRYLRGEVQNEELPRGSANNPGDMPEPSITEQ